MALGTWQAAKVPNADQLEAIACELLASEVYDKVVFQISESSLPNRLHP